MLIDQHQYELERQRLQKVLQIIDQQLKIAQKHAFTAKLQLTDTKRSLWERIQYDDHITTAQYIDELNRQGQAFGVYHNAVRKLELLQHSPYFGRIDFADDELQSTEQIYIGVGSLVDPQTREILIYDWRAPVASMFYDYGLGRAQYQAPGGIITGEILLKRQYMIEHGEIKYIFDSDLIINDEVLQSMLSKSADNRMRNIVYSIQREQNQAIRDEDTKVLLVQGPAGSGKTSIALHRAAYLLYRYHGQLKANNIVIFSPNQIFSDYIQNVLPELGEDNINQTTLQEYVKWALEGNYWIEDYYSQFEYILSGTDDPNYQLRLRGIAFKSSPEFFALLKAYVQYLEQRAFSFDDVTLWGEVIITKQECEHLFYEKYSYLPVKERLEKIRRRIIYLFKTLRKAKVQALVSQKANDPKHKGDSEWELRKISLREIKSEQAPMFEHIDKMLAFDIYQLYADLYRETQRFYSGTLPDNWEELGVFTRRNIENHLVFYEDVVPLLFLQGALAGWKELPYIQHVIIDEAQDYSLLHYELFRSIFPKAAFTILGDLRQSVHPFLKLNDFDSVASVFDSAGYSVKLLNLTRSYRSTEQIAMFANQLLQQPIQVELVERFGDKPMLIPYGEEPSQQIRDVIKACRERGCRSIAIICKTDMEAQAAFQLLKEDEEVTYINRHINYFPLGTVILPVYLAKGLEFDAVIVYNANQTVYTSEYDRSLLYTACTRALHHLYIFYEGELTPFLGAVAADLYTLKTRP